MIKRILIFGGLISVIQILFYYLLLKLFQFALTFFADQNQEFISDYNIDLSAIIFSAVVIIQNLVTTIINKNWFAWTALVLATFFYVIGWGEDIHSWPVSTTVLLIVGVSVLTGKFIIDKQLTKLQTKRRTNA